MTSQKFTLGQPLTTISNVNHLSSLQPRVVIAQVLEAIVDQVHEMPQLYYLYLDVAGI